MDIKSTSITGITSIRDADDAVSKSYVDTRQSSNIVGQEGQFLSYSTKNSVPIVTNGLVLYLDAGNTSSYPGSGTTWTDLSGSGNNITLVNGPTYSSSDGGFIVFDGTNDYGVKTTHSVTPNGGMTIDVWINMNSVDFAASEAAFLNHSGFQYLNLNFINSTNKFRLEYKSVSASNTQLFSSTTVSANTWYNFVGVVDNNGGAKIYINGVLDNSNGINANLTSTINSNLYIGYDSGGYFPNAKFAIVKEYNRPLSQLEIEQNFNAVAYRFLSGYEEPFVPTVSWEPLTNYNEYTTAGSYTFDVPSYAKEFLIEATGAGGAGASGNTDGDSWNRVAAYWSLRTTANFVTYTDYGGGISLANNIYFVGSSNVGPPQFLSSTDTIVWTYLSTPTASIYRIIHGNSLYVAGGQNGSIVVSTNGVIWQLRTSGNTGDVYNQGIYADNTYYFNYSNRLIASTDTITWIRRTSSSFFMRTIDYFNNSYISCGDSGTLTTSTDSIVWIRRTSGFGASTINALTYGNNLYVAGGNNGTLTTSTDTIHWTYRTSGTLITLNSLAYGGNYYVAVSTNRTISTSTDAIVWDTNSHNVNNNLPSRIAAVNTYANNIIFSNRDNLFVIAGYPNFVAASPLTTTGFSGGSGGSGAYASWQITKDQIAGSTLSVTVGQGGTGGKMIEPTTWTLRTSGLSNTPRGVGYGGGYYLAENRVSTDTITWTVRTLSGSGGNHYYLNNQYIYWGGSSFVSVSTDTIVWTRRTAVPSGFGYADDHSLIYANNQYSAMLIDGSANNYAYVVSTDTIVWTLRTVGLSASAGRSNGYGNGVYVTTTNGAVANSTDTISWTIRTVPFGGSPSNLLYIEKYNSFIGISPRSSTFSTDGIVWILRTSSLPGGNILDTFYAEGVFVTSQLAGSVGTSTDAINWTIRTSFGTGRYLYPVGYGKNLWFGVLNSGGVVTSTNLQAPTSATASSVSWTGPGSLTYTVSANPGGGASLPQVYPAGGSAGAADVATNNFLQTSPGRPGLEGSPMSGSLASSQELTDPIQPSSGGVGAYGNTNSFGGSSGTIFAYNSYISSPIVEINGSTGRNISGLSFGLGGSGGGVQVEPASIWSSRTSGFGGTRIRSLTYGNNLYVASGESGTITTSTDSIVWEQRTSGFGNTTIFALTYANNLYVAGGAGGTITTSTNTINWTQRTSGFGTTIIYALTYGNNLYVASGSQGTLTISTDAIVWTQRTSGFGTTIIYALTYGNNLYVAGGFTGGTISVSTDAISWIQRTSGFGTSNIYTLTYANNLYVAGGGFGTLTTSTDTIVWTYRTSGSTRSILTLRYDIGLYMFCGEVATLSTSTDAIVWTQRTSGFGVSNVYSITYGNNLYVAGGDGGKISTSYTQIAGRGGDGFRGGGGGGGGYLNIPYKFIQRGTNWSGAQNSNPQVRNIYVSIYDNLNSLYLYGSENGVIGFSKNGRSWSLRTSGVGDILLQRGIFAPDKTEKYVFAGNSSVLTTSTDSIHWQLRTSGFGISSILALTYGNGLYVAGTAGGSLTVSTDAIVWEYRTSGFTDSIISSTYGNGFYLLAQFAPGVLVSTDTIVWTFRTNTFAQTGITFYAGQNYINAVAGGTGLEVSTDTIVWTRRTTRFTRTIQALGYGNNLYLAGTQFGELNTSTDTINWTYRTSEFGLSDIWSFTYSENDRIYVATGQSSTIRFSDAFDFESKEIELAGDGGNGGDGYVKITWW